MCGAPPLYLDLKLAIIRDLCKGQTGKHTSQPSFFLSETLLSITGVKASDHMTMSLMFRYGNFSSMALEGFIILMIRLEKVLGEWQGNTNIKL